MPSIEDRAALLAAFRERLCRLQHLGLTRPSVLSTPEYLRRLALEGVLPDETVERLVSLYEACRFGGAPPAEGSWADDLSDLDAAIASLERLPEERRTMLARGWREKWAPVFSSPRPAAREHAAPPCAPASGKARNPESAVELRKQRAEEGPSRVWTAVAGALVLWTVVVVAGSLWQRDRILKALAASGWKGNWADQDDLRRMYNRKRATSGPTNLMLLGNQYVRQKNYAEAIQVYHQALERAKSHPQVEARISSRLARVLVLAEDSWYHDSVQGIRLARRAVQLHPNQPEFRDTLAEAQAKIGCYDDAVESAQAALRYATFDHQRRYYRQQIQTFQAMARERAKSKAAAEDSTALAGSAGM